MGLFRRDRAGTEIMIGASRSVERRDPTAGTQSLRYVTPGRAVPPDWDASRAFEWAYYASCAVFACVRVYADAIKGLELRVGADPDKPNDYDRNSPLAALLAKPNQDLTGRVLWDWTMEQYLVCARFGWEVEYGPKEPVGLWPLPAPYLKPIPATSGPRYFTGFEFGRSGDTRRLANDRIVYGWIPRGTDPRQVASPLEAAALAISVDVMQAKYDYSFLKNDARPPVIIVSEEFADEDSFEAFKSQWTSQYGGPDNAGRAAFVEATGEGGPQNAVQVIPVGVTPKDAQAMQRAQDVQLRIAATLGVPWSLIDASGRTFDNAKQEERNWARMKLLPRLRDFADVINMQLAPLFGPNVCWWDIAPLRLDPWADVAPADAATMYEAGLITRNEGRMVAGFSTRPDGDVFFEPPAPMPVPARVIEDETRKIHDYKGDGGECTICGKPPVHTAHGYFLPRSAVREPAVPSAPPAPVPEIDHEARRAKLWTSTNGKVRNLERQWERAFRKLFLRQQRSVLARLESKRGRAAYRGEVRAFADEIFDPAHWAAETVDDVTALYEAVTAAGGARVSDLFGLAFDLEAEWAQDFVQARANQLAGPVTETTYQAIKDALAQGVAEGEGIPELAQRVRHVFDVASTSRATTIARTEVISAFNGSATLTATQYGPDVVAGKEWIATQDARTRDWHAERDGEIVGIGEAFSGGLAYPGDGDAAEAVNCRCTVAFLTPDDMASRTGRGRYIERRVAAAVLATIRPGSFDEQHVRAALRAAA